MDDLFGGQVHYFRGRHIRCSLWELGGAVNYSLDLFPEGRYGFGMPFKDPEARRQWERDRAWKRKTEARRTYERERRNRKRLEAYERLPEPERTRRLEANARRRALNLRWGGRGY